MYSLSALNDDVDLVSDFSHVSLGSDPFIWGIFAFVLYSCIFSLTALTFLDFTLSTSSLLFIGALYLSHWLFYPSFHLSSVLTFFLRCRPVWFSWFRSTFSQCHQDWLGSDWRYWTVSPSFAVLIGKLCLNILRIIVNHIDYYFFNYKNLCVFVWCFFKKVNSCVYRSYVTFTQVNKAVDRCWALGKSKVMCQARVHLKLI